MSLPQAGQVVVVHPYSTIKWQLGFNYILTKKGKALASAAIGLMYTAYNLWLIVNILDIRE